jgi:hypothetical protein
MLSSCRGCVSADGCVSSLLLVRRVRQLVPPLLRQGGLIDYQYPDAGLGEQGIAPLAWCAAAQAGSVLMVQFAALIAMSCGVL